MTNTPSRAELVGRVSGLTDLFRKHASWQEQNRRLHDETIDALADAGIFKLRTPTRYGGYEVDARTLVDVSIALGKADGATAWTASVYWIPTWMIGMFPDAVQDEVFAEPDTRVCGTLSPSAIATPTDGGLVVNGRWGFISGALHAQWQEIIAMAPTPDGQGQWPVMAVVPMSDLEIVDDWHTSGLRGTGSVTTVAKDLFVPAERVVPLPLILQGQSASERNAGKEQWRAPLLAVANASSPIGMMIGIAAAAVEHFTAELPTKKITYTDYANKAEAPITHLQLAQAALKVDQATFHGHRIADTVDRKSAAGEPWSLEERARTRADVGAAALAAKEAIDILASGGGGSSIYEDAPIQRIVRDIHAANQHALVNPHTNFELYGRILAGQEPNTVFI